MAGRLWELACLSSRDDPLALGVDREAILEKVTMLSLHWSHHLLLVRPLDKGHLALTCS